MKKKANLTDNNPLAVYLSAKKETNNKFVPLKKAPEFVLLPHKVNANPKVLLINPPLCIPAGQPKRCIPPSAITYIGGYLRSVGVHVELLDCIIEGWDNEVLVDTENKIYVYGMSENAIEEYLLKSNPDIIGISLLFSQDLVNAFNVARAAKKTLPNAIVILGGLHPTIYPEETLNTCQLDGLPVFDYILRGEGEKRLAAFVNNYRQGFVDKNADGLVGYFDGKLVINPEIEKIGNLDDLPIPAYDLLPMDRYFSIDMPCNCFPAGKRTMAVHTSRGCPVGCTFCSSTNYNRAFRTRSPQKVYEEIKHYIDAYDVDEIQFMDDNLLLNRKRVEEIFDIIKPLNIKWCTPNGTMVITWTPNLMQKAAESGMYQVTLAVDGTTKESHAISGKPVDIENLPDKIDAFRKLNILVHGFFVIGLPGETKEDIKRGFEWVKTLNFTSVSIYIAQPYPGSELYETELRKGNIIKEDGLRVVKTKSVIQNLSVSNTFLEESVRTFTLDYEKIIKSRESSLWDARYSDKLKKFKDPSLHLVIGQGDRINMLLNADSP